MAGHEVAGHEVAGHEVAPPADAAAVAALRQLGADRVTGALVVTGAPGGTIFLVDGAVHAAESPGAPSPGELLVGRGLVTVQQWEAVLGADSTPESVLVDTGLLTAGEWELCTLEAMYDAAYATLVTEPTDLHFDPGRTGRTGVHGGVAATELCAGVERQRRILDEVLASDGNDHAPVRPVARPGLHRVLVSGLQWEIVLHADGRRCPVDLARLLGCPAFAVQLDVRRLVAAGLVQREPWRTAGPGVTPQVAPAPRPPVEPAPQAPTVTERSLPRRVPGSNLPATAESAAASTAAALAGVPGMTARPADDSVLRRIRVALQALR